MSKNAKELLEEIIKTAKSEEGQDRTSAISTGIRLMSSEQIEELIQLADEDGLIEIDGALVKIISSADQVPEELKDFIRENSEDGHCHCGKCTSREAQLKDFLASDKVIETTDIIMDLMEEKEIHFNELLAAVFNIGMIGYSDETIGIGGIDDINDYIDYLDEIQIEMKTAQALVPTNPVINVVDLMNAALLSAVDTMVVSPDMMESALMMHRLASVTNQEHVDEIAFEKVKLAQKIAKMANDANESEETLDIIRKRFNEETGLDADDIIEQVKNNVSHQDICSQIHESIKNKAEVLEPEKADSKEVC